MSTKPEPTTEQLSIIDYFRSTPDNIMINAYAGTGKTATLEMIERASRQHPMLYLVFNKKNAEEAKSRMRTSTAVRTFNSFGHRIWADYIGKPLKLDGKKVQTILTEIISTAPRDTRNQLSDSYWFIVDSVNRARALGYIPTGKFPNAEPLVRQGQFHKALEETPDDLSAALIDKVLTECITLSYKGHIDFNDQIYMPALFGGRYPKFPIAMVDEFQDLSPINHAMLDHISKQRIIGVGDIYQNIYGFRGAKADGMNDAQTKFSMHHASLSVSFRCPSNIIARARRQVPDIVAWKHGGEFAEIDADPDVNTQDGATSNIARRVAYEFKAEFGELKYTKANRCIAGDWVRKRFREMDMRYVDIAIHMDMCVELCLLPTKHAVRAAALARTHEVRDRRSVVDFAK